MKKLLGILVICLISAPALAWQEFDGTITDTVILEYTTYAKDMENELITPTDPSPTDLVSLRVEMGLEAVAEYVPSVPGVHVYDAEGYHVGLLIGFDGSSIMIYLTDVETVFTVDSKTGSAKTAFVYYESNDCTGKPYVHAGSQYSITKACDTLYTGKRRKPKFMTTQSRLIIEGNKCTCWDHSLESYFTPAVEVAARTVGLYLPIALPLRFQAWSMPTD